VAGKLDDIGSMTNIVIDCEGRAHVTAA